MDLAALRCTLSFVKCSVSASQQAQSGRMTDSSLHSKQDDWLKGISPEGR
jgi:hypothetical protein